MARNTSLAVERPSSLISILLKSVLLSLGLTLSALCILALCIAFGPVTEAVDTCIYIASIISVFLAGFIASRRSMRRGLLVGMLAGILYVLFSYVLGTLLCGTFSPNGSLWKMLALSILTGGIGGIFGMNVRRKKY